MSESQRIAIEDVGPVADVEFEYIPQPGLNVITGPHNSGKSTILRTVEWLTTGDTAARPTKARGAKQGRASVGDKVLTFKKQVRSSGDLGLDSLGDLDIVSLHRPKYDSRQRRDVQRTACLVRLAGVDGGAEMFSDLPDFEKITDGIDISGDLVAAASQVKRAYQAEARRIETEMDKALADKDAQAELYRDVDVEASDNVEALAMTHKDAMLALDRLKSDQKFATEAKEKGDKARQWVNDNPPPLHSVEQIEAAQSENRKSADSIRDTIAELQEQLVKLAEDATSLQTEKEKTLSYDSDSEQCRAALKAEEEHECPTDEDIEAADKVVATAWEQLLNAQKIGEAKKAKESSKEFAKTAKELEKKADTVRETASKVADVLAGAVSAIPRCPISAGFDDDGDVELTVADDDGKPVLFDEQSDGTRWKIILPMCMNENRMIVIPQDAFGELSDETKQMLHDEAKSRDCFLITGKVTNHDTPLVGQVWELGM